jgi:hypothetical protein
MLTLKISDVCKQFNEFQFHDESLLLALEQSLQLLDFHFVLCGIHETTNLIYFFQNHILNITREDRDGAVPGRT